MAKSAPEAASPDIWQEYYCAFPFAADREARQLARCSFKTTGPDYSSVEIKQALSYAIERLRLRLVGHPDPEIASALRVLQDYADIINRDVFVARADIISHGKTL